MLIHDFLEYYARNIPDQSCVNQVGLNDDTQIDTYLQMSNTSNKLANALLGAELGDNLRVAVLGENSVEHVRVMMACSKIGAVFVPLNYRLAPAELAYVINDAGVQVLLVLDGMQESYQGLKSLLSDKTKVYGHNVDDCEDWKGWWSSSQDSDPMSLLDADTALMQLYTSGTTGNPKGVLLSHNNALALASMNNAASAYRTNPGTSGIICAPLFHIGGSGSVIAGIYGGQEILLHKAFNPMLVLDHMEQYPVNSVFLVPAMIGAMLQTPNIADRNLSGLKQIFYGASPISETLLRQALAVFQCDFIQMYGMTETTGTIINLSAADHRKALDDQPELLRAAGRPSVGVQIKIANDQGQEVPDGDIGEVLVRSDSNMLGYHNLPEATAETLTNGWIHTGDAGYKDSKGYIFLKDRIKDMVVSGAENIYPVEVENAIAKHESVLDVAVIGIPDEKFGEALLAFVVLKPGAEFSNDSLIEFCRDKIAGYKIPRQLEIISELPRNATGKVLKTELRKPYWQGSDRSIA